MEAVLFDPVEHAILSDYFGLPRPAGCEDVPSVRVPTGHGGWWVGGGSEGDLRLSAAVARIVLSAIQQRLPDFADFFQSGEVRFGRRHQPRPRRKVRLKPELLFSINWANTAPGMCWPETYHVAYVPGYDRYVVTASQDSADTFGYTDQAIGWFDASRPVVEGAGEVLKRWWRWFIEQKDQEPWGELWTTGLVCGEAVDWQDEVWGRHLDFARLLAVIRAPTSDEDDVASAFEDIVAVAYATDRPPTVKERAAAQQALWECFDGETPVPALQTIIRALAWGWSAACYGVEGVLADPRLADQVQLRVDVLVHLIRHLPDDDSTLRTVAERLLDGREKPVIRQAAAELLRRATGREEFAQVQALLPPAELPRLPTGNGRSLSGAFARRLAQRCLRRVTREVQGPPPPTTESRPRG